MLLIIGLDGATWDVAEPLIGAGRMPNLARLRRHGLAGPLASTIPPATFPSWTTFATGVNPGRHGIFDFTRRTFGTYEVSFVNATFRASASVWRRLSDAGRRVCVLGQPATYPPEPLNGCMVSGFDTPVTTRADASFVYPREMAPLIMELGGFPFADFQEFRVGTGWYDMALGRLRRGIEIKTRLARRLLQREAWDSLMVVFGESDTVAHHFWKFHDPSSPRFEPADARLRGAIDEIYTALDVAVGELMAAACPENVVVVSDHGFGGAGRKCVYLNQLLAQHGLQRRQDAPPRLSSALKRFALKAVPASLQARAFRLNGGRWASRLESNARFAGIDWPRTTAFSEELNYFPSVWLNVQGREPQGRVAPSDYERVRDDVIAVLTDLRDPITGRAVVKRALRREEAFHGPWTSHAPDVVLELGLDDGHSYNCMPSTSWSGGGVFRELQDHDLQGGKLSSMSGSHRSDGLFVLAGDSIAQPGWVTDAAIQDLTPTIMSLAACEPPEDLDGRSLVRREGLVSAPPSEPGSPLSQPYTAAEEREIAARLGALGYLD